ncbi:hypothetical protein HMPREF1548_06779 [Clostridium sp. KLE 1755]|nr:hypothetical protein HMPREF1548_06779 [Clostridium sp. KLE 1755]
MHGLLLLFCKLYLQQGKRAAVLPRVRCGFFLKGQSTLAAVL